MIVRISGEGQYDVPDDRLDQLNRLDAELEKALRDSEAAELAFRGALAALLDVVRVTGKPVADAELVPSDLVLPYAEATAADVRDSLGSEGLIPG